VTGGGGDRLLKKPEDDFNDTPDNELAFQFFKKASPIINHDDPEAERGKRGEVVKPTYG